MSDGLNKVMLLGNLGADPELRFTQAGQAVLNLRLATTESYLDKDKVRRDRTDWHNVVVWGKRGEALAKILKKGSSIFVEGGLRTDTYDDRDGNKRHKTEIHASNIVLAGRVGGDHDAPADSGDAAPPRQQVAPAGRMGGYGGNAGCAPSTGGVAYPGVRSAGDFEVRFGRDAGKRISMVEDLSWLRGAIMKSINDPSKAQHAESNKAQVNAIDEEVARRKGGGATATAAPVDDGYGEGGVDDLPF